MLLLCLTAFTADAQWSVGVKGGWDYTTIMRSNAGRIDESYSRFSGFDAGPATILAGNTGTIVLRITYR